LSALHSGAKAFLLEAVHRAGLYAGEQRRIVDLGLNGKTALVPAAGGAGSAIAMTLARDGARTASVSP
jgi:hypothetical protein